MIIAASTTKAQKKEKRVSRASTTRENSEERGFGKIFSTCSVFFPTEEGAAFPKNEREREKERENRAIEREREREREEEKEITRAERRG